MSILTINNNQLSPEEILAKRAEQLKISSARFAEQIYTTWAQQFDSIWKSDQFTPAQKIEALGTDAGELFTLSGGIVQFMITVFTGRRDDLVVKIMERVNTMPTFTINPNGSVTL